MRILITGASGFIGRNLLRAFHEKGIHVTAYTRDKRQLPYSTTNLHVIENLKDIASDYPLDAVINLAGAPIDKRWSKGYKQVLLHSRLDVTQALYHLVARLKVKPKVVISASAVGYYGNQGGNPIYENSPPNRQFTHTLCTRWEQAALNIGTVNTRICIIRLGVVLGKDSRMVKKVLPLFYLGLGGKIGAGTQYMSWIHIHDVIRAIEFLLKTNTDNVTIYNLTSPFPVTNAEWTKALSCLLHRPAWFPVPRAIVRLVFGEMGETLLANGQNVLPQNLTKAGFTFTYKTIHQALEEIVKQKGDTLYS